MISGLRLCLCVVCGLVLATQGAKVTPIQKVISLLKDLSVKVAAEGKKEAAQYDKYACFCKEQADEKLYSIEKSDAKIADLKAQIKELTTAISSLNSDISDLSNQISGLESEIDRKTRKRAAQHKEYLARAKDMNEAIAACGAAIEALKDSKKAMKGAKVDLAQVTSGLVKAVSKQPALVDAASKVSLLSKIGSSGAPKFEYQSNDIIVTIEDLMATFKRMKKDLDFEEHDVNSSFEKNKLGLENEKAFAEKEKAEKEAIVEAKTEDNEAAKEDRDGEQADRNADDAFMKQLEEECRTKAEAFDQRSSTRANEMKALTDATAELESGAAPNFAGNRKLVGLQKSSKPPSSPLAFVQINSVENLPAKKSAALQKVQSFISVAAGRTGSGILSTIAARIGVAADHFVKVRGLIKDLIAKLEADAKAEATQKGVCDTGMAKAIKDRDDANAQIEAANAKITTQTAKKNALEDEIETLEGEIAELKKALLEATELRGDEKAENHETEEMTQEGADAVKLAMGILKGFYDKAFMQTGKYVPPNSDRSGNTVGDLAPEFDDSSYHGAQAESKGIIGILEVILSDFNRSNNQAEKDDSASKKAYQEFEKEDNDDVAKKEARIKGAEGELSAAKGEILDQQGALSDAKELLESALQSLDDLEAMCVKGEETWEERKAKREAEIEALKNALEILNNWQA